MKVRSAHWVQLLSNGLGGSTSSLAEILRCHCAITQISPKHAPGGECLKTRGAIECISYELCMWRDKHRTACEC